MRTLAAAALLAVLCLAAGCGSEAGGGERTTAGERPLAKDALPVGKDKLSREQIERFARIKLPAGVEDLHSFHAEGGMDESIDVSFTLPRAELDGFLAASRFSQPPQEGLNPFTRGAGAKLGWDLEAAEDVAGLNEVVDQGFGRLLMVAGRASERPTVYLTASTL